MNCPHCHKPLDSAQLRKALNAELAKRKRPGAKGLVRNPKGRKKSKPAKATAAEMRNQ